MIHIFLHKYKNSGSLITLFCAVFTFHIAKGAKLCTNSAGFRAKQNSKKGI